MVENVANLGKRILGGVIDVIVLVVFMFVYFRVFGTKIDATNTYHIQGGFAWLMYLIMLFYFVVLEKITGKTIGKYIAKTKVVNQNGQLMSWWQSLVRNLMRIIDGLFFYLVAVIAIASSSKNQRLGDMVVRTYVIND
ncbi:MAG: RDD family protein [Gammaproteobacteria bacterium]|jgi:uncharacterized RDD family membrane protein YckC